MGDEAAEKESQRRREDAKAAHEYNLKNVSENFTLVGSFSNAAMRAPALAAAGGIAGILGFFSANKNAMTGTEGVALFNAALFYFCVSVLLCVLAPAAAYLSQTCYTYWAGTHSHHWDHPYVRETPRAMKWRNAGIAFQVISMGIVIGSMSSLVMGGWYFMALAAFIAR